MSVQTFIPQIWEAALLTKFNEKSIAEVITTAPERIEGNKIIFNHVADVDVTDYEGSVSWDELSLDKVELNMDIKKKFNFKVSDVDAVQAAGNLMTPHMQRAGVKMQEELDKAVLTEALTTENEVTRTNENAYDLIVKCNTELNKKKVSKSDRYAVINSEILEQLQLDPRFTANYTVLENGIVDGAKINGVQLVLSEELNGGVAAIVVLHKSAIGFGKQLDKVEAMRLENSMADGVRGLGVAGTKILRPDAVVKCVPSFAARAAKASK